MVKQGQVKQLVITVFAEAEVKGVTLLRNYVKIVYTIGLFYMKL